MIPPPLSATAPAAVPPPLGAGGYAIVRRPVGAGADAVLFPPVAAGAPAAVPAPVGAGAPGAVPAPLGAGAPAAVPSPLAAGAPARVPAPVGAGAPAAVPAPVGSGGPAAVPSPLGAGAPAAVPAPIGAGGPAAVRPLVRVYDVWLSFLALVGALGQWTSQNERNYPPGHVEENIAVAWREFQLAWERRHQPVQLFADHHDVAHIARFARLVFELTDLERMVGIQVPLKPDGTRNEDDVDPPLIDRLLRNYFLKHYGFAPIVPPQGGVHIPPLIDYV